MRTGSVCSGYGGLDAAVREVLGGELAWVADNDPDKSAILAHRFPGVPNLGDLEAVDWSAVEPVDVLTAGFPCTDISCAGRRAGLRKGNRSGVWYFVARAIAELRPPLVVIENVKELLSERADSDVESCPWCMGDAGPESAMRALGAVLADLAEIGFDAEWISVPAASAGACHLRWRVFILAWPAADAGSSRPRNTRNATAGRSPDSSAHSGTTLCDAVQLLPTPRASANENRQTKRTPSQETGDHGLCLAAEVLELLPGGSNLLPTPRATDGTHGGPNQRGSSGDLMLPSAFTHLLPTPTTADGGGGHLSRSGDRSGELLLPGIVRELSGGMRQQSGSMSESSAG